MILGLIAAILITIAYLPQCVKMYNTKKVIGLSWYTFFLVWLGMIFFIIHSINIKDLPLFISSIASFIQNSYILYAIFKYKK